MDYYDIVEDWVREFICTMDEGRLEAGDASGDAPFGVKIIFDGYGYDEETDEENANENMMSFAVFVHRDSLTKEFPPHELTPWALIHRPKEEICIYAWYDVEADDVEIILNENDEVNVDEYIELIQKIHQRAAY